MFKETEWTVWSSCSITCGQVNTLEFGTRHYLMGCTTPYPWYVTILCWDQCPIIPCLSDRWRDVYFWGVTPWDVWRHSANNYKLNTNNIFITIIELRRQGEGGGWGSGWRRFVRWHAAGSDPNYRCLTSLHFDVFRRVSILRCRLHTDAVLHINRKLCQLVLL